MGPLIGDLGNLTTSATRGASYHDVRMQWDAVKAVTPVRGPSLLLMALCGHSDGLSAQKRTSKIDVPNVC